MGTNVKTLRMTTLGVRLFAALALASSASCSVGPNYEAPDVAVAPEFRSQPGPQEATSFADLPWWQVFQDDKLQALIVEALNNNNDLDAAVARIEQARALVGVARSEFFPQVEYGGAVGEEAAFVPQADSVDAVEYSGAGGGLSAAWELDLWGRVRRSSEAAQAHLMAEEYMRRGVTLALVSDVAAGYFRLLRLDRELQIAQESAGVYRDTRDLFTLRFELGRDSRLPVERVRAAHDASIARIADVRREIEQQENALCVLLGRYPSPIERGLPLGRQTTPQTPPGLTTDLLRRRPDILAAEQDMIAANAEIGVAVANFFPRIGLSAFAGEQSVDLDNGLSGSFGVWNIFGTLAGPIFTGGRLASIYNARRAYWDETIADYRQTVLVSFQETSDALAAQRLLAERRAAQETQVQALRQSVELSLLRYEAGRASYFEVLEAEQQLFPAEDALANTQQAQLAAVISLYKALGGGWTLSPEQWAQPG